MPRISVRQVLPGLSLPPYFVSADDLKWLRSNLRDAGFEVFEATVADCTDEQCLLARIGDALPFPDYVGHNWDAFDDCVGDLQSEGSGPVALVLDGSDELLRSSPRAFIRSVHLLQDVVQAVGENEEGGLQLEVFFVGDFGRRD